MPFRGYAAEYSFTPEDIEVIRVAFDAVCSELSITDTDPLAATAANHLSKLAAAGHRDPVRLQKAVLALLKM